MLNNYKLLVLDMDGTAYKKLGTVVEANVKPIIKAQELGTKVVFITGRPLFAKQNQFEENGFTKHESVVIGYNGALIYDANEKLELKRSLIPAEKIKAIFKYVIENNVEGKNLIWGYSESEDLVFLNKKVENTKLEVELLFYNENFKFVNENNLNELKPCFKLLASDCTEDFLQKLDEYGFEVAYSHYSDIAEINDKGINKKFGVEFLCNKYNIKAEEVIAMGDGKNDVSMMKFVGLPIAPKNASPLVKEVSKIISDKTGDEAAVADVINEYFLKGEN